MTEQNSNHSFESGFSERDFPNRPQEGTPSSQTEQNNEFPIVGIGASAGGLAAFEKLFSALPPDSGLAFVVVQHLSPPHKSILPEIIQRYTSMPVAQVTEGVKVKPNGVYVIPPGSDLVLRDGHLMLLKPETNRYPHLPIDLFFRSLAQDQAERAIGIVLSGTGSDGSLGLRTIKAEGGLTIAQEPDTAEFGDMPRNAIATEDIDFVLPAEKMGELILKYTNHQIIVGPKRSESDFQIPPGGMQKLYSLLRLKTGHDFSQYKQNTLLRRIERRMKITLVKTLDAYIDRLQEYPEEINALFQEMLINVTHFFRDPEAYQALIDKAIRPLILTKQTNHDPIRVWVAGCSSGEEAYSIAIAIQEQIEDLKTMCKVQIYATDLDAQAITAARKGLYRDGNIENVSTERLQRFFYQDDEGYQIKKNIRDMIVFSTQDLIADPPFSKIDLLCCRNVLIYLEHDLQNQLFHQFHYSLKPDGILFLGNSESIGRNTDLFSVIDRKHKLFQRREAVRQRAIKTKTKTKTNTKTFSMPFVSPGPESRSARSQTGGLREWTEKVLLDFHTPACVIVDQNHNILFIHGRTGKYLEPVPGETSTNLVRMAREGLKPELVNALHAAARKETVRREGVQVKTNGDYQPIVLTVRPFAGPADSGDLLMVVFEEMEGAPSVEKKPKTPEGKSRNPRVAQLEEELKEKDEYLRTIIDELEETNQDLRSTNEEMQSTNEEMQSTNEELETAKEELQSINEELSTINAEVQNKNDELSAVNNDMYNLLVSTEIGTIFLNLDLQIRRFTPAANRIYNFLPTDIGRPIGHFVSNLEVDHLVADIHQVLNTLVPKAIEAQTKDGTWYLISIKPYRTLENVIDGAVITFVDITRQKQGDELRRLGTVLRDSNDAVTVNDFNGKILAWNRGATQMYGWTEAEALKMNTLDMIPENKRAETVAIFKRLSEGEDIHSFESQWVSRDGKTLDVWLTLTALVNDANQPIAVATTGRDITNRKWEDKKYFFENRALKALNHLYKALFERSGPTSLVEKACRILVEDAGYRLAWIGRVQKDKAKTIRPIAWAGIEAGEPEPAETAWPLSEIGRGPMKRALSSSAPVAVRHLSTDWSQDISSADASVRRYGSFLILPVIPEKNPPGVLMIYATEPDAFMGREIEYLSVFSKQIFQEVGPF